MLVLACLATFVLGAVPALAVKGLSLKVIGMVDLLSWNTTF